MSAKIEVQLHLWPWSIGIREETVDLTTGAASFPFYGSPVVSVSTHASLFLPQRHERFTPFGPTFETLGGKYHLYETPHGIMATRGAASIESGGKIRVHTEDLRETVRIFPQGAKPRIVQHGEGGEDIETELARVVLAWSQIFDDLIKRSKSIKGENKLPWSELEGILLRVSEEVAEPRMALIVDIAEHMHGRLPIVVNAPRKILLRERRMLSAGRVVETDIACLRWLVRQPGETMSQKASANRQRLLGIARSESFDTLENRVLKDFLLRCSYESQRYLNTEVGDDQMLKKSNRSRTVRRYRYLCTDLHQVPHLEDVSAPPSPIRPNYVLQNDHRYKQVWQQYVRLLRREDEEDRLWDWQSRTWADVARLFVNAALFELSRESRDRSNAQLIFEELLTSLIHLLSEQHLGSRTASGSEPGPFLVRRQGMGRDRASILEVVHSDQAEEHSATRVLGRLGGHLYLVLTPLSGSQRTVVVIWSVHTAGAEKHPSWKEISHSAGKALENHTRNLDELRDPDLPVLRGFVVASHMESRSAELEPGVEGGLHLIRVATDQRCWEDAIKGGITPIIEDILEEVL